MWELRIAGFLLLSFLFPSGQVEKEMTKMLPTKLAQMKAAFCQHNDESITRSAAT
jgi:hypothetical protein